MTTPHDKALEAAARLVDAVPDGLTWDYRLIVLGGRLGHMWTLRGPRGGIHVSANWSDIKGGTGSYWWGGIECHSPISLYDHQKEPTQKHCWLIDKPCWHDGSSLQFSEQIAHALPDANDQMGWREHAYILRIMLDRYSSWLPDQDAISRAHAEELPMTDTATHDFAGLREKLEHRFRSARPTPHCSVEPAEMTAILAALELADEHATLKEDRDLWKQSEASCSAQYDKLVAENAALKKRVEPSKGESDQQLADAVRDAMRQLCGDKIDYDLECAAQHIEAGRVVTCSPFAIEVENDQLEADNAALREGLRRAIAELEKSDRRRCKSLGKLRTLIGKEQS